LNGTTKRLAVIFIRRRNLQEKTKINNRGRGSTTTRSPTTQKRKKQLRETTQRSKTQL
jgi:hypothetical protein